MASARQSMKAPLTASTSPGSSSPRWVARYWLREPEASSERPAPVKGAGGLGGGGEERLQAWARVLGGGGKERLQACPSSPDSVRSLQPTMPIRSSERSRAKAASSVPA